jgi:hypothetical protein
MTRHLPSPVTFRIGGRLDYHLLAQLHRPADTASLARAARDLLAQGLTANDVAQHLRLPLAWVIGVTEQVVP